MERQYGSGLAAPPSRYRRTAGGSEIQPRTLADPYLCARAGAGAATGGPSMAFQLRDQRAWRAGAHCVGYGDCRNARESGRRIEHGPDSARYGDSAPCPRRFPGARLLPQRPSAGQLCCVAGLAVAVNQTVVATVLIQAAGDRAWRRCSDGVLGHFGRSGPDRSDADCAPVVNGSARLPAAGTAADRSGCMRTTRQRRPTDSGPDHRR